VVCDDVMDERRFLSSWAGVQMT